MDKKWVSDFIKIEGGQFIDKGNIARPTLAYLVSKVYVGNQSHQNRGLIILEPGNLQVQLTDGAFDQAKVTGSEGQKLYEQLNLGNKIFGNEFEKPKDTNMLLLSIASNNGAADYYIRPNRKSAVSIALLPSLVKNNIISLDSASAILNKLPNSYKLLIEDVEPTLLHLLQEAPRQHPFGRFLPRMIATDSKGSALDTRNYWGKYVLVNFWTVRSSESKEINPQLLKLYDKYKDKNIEFLGISPEKNKQIWLNAIDKNGIGKWRNIYFSDELNYKNKNKIKKMFDVYDYPAVQLYDRSGELIYSPTIIDGRLNLHILERVLATLLNK